ncbi:MAG: hypothetical protein CVV48_08280 [Spirochaetae bacterium HGW-Spirochaetae-4]|nr:MAG: hypothetical protein CVV48_08280 [Spirochaetae bacterium HGW-Spirochaetae-4]
MTMDRPLTNAAQHIGNTTFGTKLRRIIIQCPKHGPVGVFATTDQFGIEYIGKCLRCVEEESAAEATEFKRRREDPALQLRNRMIDAGIPDDYLDESFQTFAFNGWDDPHRVFVEYAQLFAENRDRTLVVLGKPGVGKTHVACSMLREMIVQGSTALYVTEGALLRQIRSTFSKKGGPTEEDVFRRYTSCDVLVMDEMGVAPWSDYSVQALADIIDTRVSRKKKTVFLGNMDMETFKRHLSDASISRISMGKTFEVTGDDYRKLKKRQGRV